MVQSNARYQAPDTPTFHVHSIKMPVGFGTAATSKGRPLSVIAHLQNSLSEGYEELSSARARDCQGQNGQRSQLQSLQAGVEDFA